MKILKFFLKMLKYLFYFFLTLLLLFIVFLLVSKLFLYDEEDFNIPKDFFQTRFANEFIFDEANGNELFLEIANNVENDDDLKTIGEYVMIHYLNRRNNDNLDLEQEALTKNKIFFNNGKFHVDSIIARKFQYTDFYVQNEEKIAYLWILKAKDILKSYPEIAENYNKEIKEKYGNRKKSDINNDFTDIHFETLINKVTAERYKNQREKKITDKKLNEFLIFPMTEEILKKYNNKNISETQIKDIQNFEKKYTVKQKIYNLKYKNILIEKIERVNNMLTKLYTEKKHIDGTYIYLTNGNIYTIYALHKILSINIYLANNNLEKNNIEKSLKYIEQNQKILNFFIKNYDFKNGIKDFWNIQSMYTANIYYLNYLLEIAKISDEDKSKFTKYFSEPVDKNILPFAEKQQYLFFDYLDKLSKYDDDLYRVSRPY